MADIDTVWATGDEMKSTVGKRLVRPLARPGEGYGLTASPWMTRLGTVALGTSSRKSVLPNADRHASAQRALALFFADLQRAVDGEELVDECS